MKAPGYNERSFFREGTAEITQSQRTSSGSHKVTDTR